MPTFNHVFTSDNLRTLMAPHPAPCLSLMMPMSRKGEATQNAIRLKNLTRDGEMRLIESGMKEKEAEAFLQPLRDALLDYALMSQQSNGLAVYLSSDLFEMYALPYPINDLAVVNGRFDLKPVLPLLVNDGRFFVLGLSQHAARLFQGTRQLVSEMPLRRMSRSEDVVPKEREKRTVSAHTSAKARPGVPGTSMFHGHGGHEEEGKMDARRYCLAINHEIHGLLKDENAPLILAGVDPMVSIYRAVNTYPHLKEESMSGNPELMRPEEIHQAGWPMVEPEFKRGQFEALQLFQQIKGFGKATTEIRKIIPAASTGRVATLFVAQWQHLWGTYEPETETTAIHDRHVPGDEDLLDLAAFHTILNGGRVFAIRHDEMPSRSVMGAIFRY